MTDRIHSLTVVFEDFVREDDMEAYVQAIKLMKGVAAVGKNVVNIEQYAATEMARANLRGALLDVLLPGKGD